MPLQRQKTGQNPTGKGALASGDDNGTNILVLIELFQDLVELDKKTVAERVQGLGAVEGDESDASSGFG